MVFQKDGFSKVRFSWPNNFLEKDFMVPTINFSSLFKNFSPLFSYLIFLILSKQEYSKL